MKEADNFKYYQSRPIVKDGVELSTFLYIVIMIVAFVAGTVQKVNVIDIAPKLEPIPSANRSFQSE